MSKTTPTMGGFQTDSMKLFVLHSHHKTRLVLLHYSYILLSVIISLTFKCVSSEPNPIMAFPSEPSGSYSLFPNEDLRTGKKLRFDEDLNRDRDRAPYRTGDRYRSYPIMFEDRFHRPGDYNYRTREQDTRTPYLDSLRTRGSRVYFDDDRTRYSSSPYDRYPPYPSDRNQYQDYQRPSLLHRPLSPVISHQPHRPFHHHYRPDVSPGPSLSKLPVGAGDADVRIHVYDPASNSFGNPRTSGRLPGDRNRNFIETGGPGPDLFINHDQYLDYHRTIAIQRELEFRKLQKTLGNKQENEPGSKKVLFSSKQPFDIAGLAPPPDQSEKHGISMKPVDVDDIGKGKIITFTGQDGRLSLVGLKDPNNSEHKNPDDEVKSGNLQIHSNRNIINNNNDQSGGGTGHVTRNRPESTTTNSDVNSSNGHAKDDKLESENAKSQVTQIPPQQHQQPKNFISKSGRQLVYERPTADFNTTQRTTTIANDGANSDGNSKSGEGNNNNNGLRNSRADGTDFQLTSSNNAGQALPLIQADTNGFVPNVPLFLPLAGGEIPRAPTTQLGSKGDKSELRTEVTKSRIKSNTASKVAIIKQQELKQRQKLKLQNNYNHQTITTKLQNENLHDQLTKTTFAFKTAEISPSDTQTSSLSRSSPRISSSETNFRIPVLPVIDTESKLDSPYLDNNDILGPTNNAHDVYNYNNIANQFPSQPQDDGHFSLINLNNDQVDIHDPHGVDGVHVDDHPLQLTPHPSGPLSSSSDSSDLDHGDSLLYLGTNDAFVNKTFKSPKVLATTSAAGALNNHAASNNYIKVVRVKNLQAPANFKTTFAATNNNNAAAIKFNSTTATTADKTLSLFMAKRMDPKSKKNLLVPNYTASSLLNHNWTNAFKWNVTKIMDNRLTESKSPAEVNGTSATRIVASVKAAPSSASSSASATASTHQMSMSKGVIAKVHAHVSHCPKLQAPTEVICDIHIRESHGHPNPQLTVGWRRKFYNSTQPDVLLVLNKTQVYDDDDDEKKSQETRNGTTTDSNSSTSTIATTTIYSSSGDEADSAKSESLEDFHDKFNVTLAPGISPMLRSVLLIRTVAAPDTGNYQCEVSDGFYTLTSETLLFLCH